MIRKSKKYILGGGIELKAHEKDKSQDGGRKEEGLHGRGGLRPDQGREQASVHQVLAGAQDVQHRPRLRTGTTRRKGHYRILEPPKAGEENGNVDELFLHEPRK